MRSSAAEVNDLAWNALILIAIKHQKRLGRYHSIRYDRMVVYTVRNLCELAQILVDDGVIQSWSGGFRRLHSIESNVVEEFRKLHRKFHTDP